MGILRLVQPLLGAPGGVGVRLEFTVFGIAQPKGSTRAFVPKGWTRPIITSDNPKGKGWQALVAEGASRALEQLPIDERHTDGPVHVTIAFYLPRPKYLQATKKYPQGKPSAHLTKPDIDKCLRNAIDAMTGVVWTDDSQVVQVTASKRYAEVDNAPRAVVRVEAIEEPTMAPHVVAPDVMDLFAVNG